MPDHANEPDRTTNRDPKGRAAAPRVRPAGFFRTLVVAAVAAAAPVAGCYESGPDEDASDSATRDDAMAPLYGVDDAGAREDVMAPAYGVPDDADESSARYSVPMYGAP